MLIIIELAMLIWGIYVLFAGKLSVGQNLAVQGVAARLLSLLLIAPLPAALTFGIMWGLQKARLGQPITNEDNLTITGIEFVGVLVCGVVVYVLGRAMAEPDYEAQAAYQQYYYPPPGQQPQTFQGNPYSDNPYQAPTAYSNPPPGGAYGPPPQVGGPSPHIGPPGSGSPYPPINFPPKT